MRRYILPLYCGVLTAWGIACLIALIALSKTDRTIAPAIPSVPDADNSYVREIPLTSIVSTSSQQGLQHATASFKPDGYEQPFGRALGQITRELNGASNAFVVDAPTVAGAVGASRRTFIGAGSADTPLSMNMPDPPRGNYWLVVFLGIRGSTPTHWLIDSVTLQGNRVRFSYHQKEHGGETADLYHYLYWVPLGSLSPGVYHLELYDTKLKAATLIRRIEVKQYP